jgi:DNA polymerase elongation subunit (family B)
MAELNDAGEEKFIGAYVKAPIVGKYEWIYDLDLTSLYPSIIMTINISPETKVGKIQDWDSQKFMKNEVSTYYIGNDVITRDNLEKFLKESKYSISSNGVLYTQDKVGCIPGILDLWFQQRVEFRKLEKKYGEEGDQEKYAFYKKRQLVQKILLNSLYGVLGLPAFRFYDIDNAEAVTTTGQTVIKSTADMVNIKYNKELNTTGVDSNIYIDTDSVFFSAVPLLNHRIPTWRDNDQNIIAGYVNDIASEVQDYLNNFYNILSEKVFNVDSKKHRFEIKKEYVAKAGIWIAKKRYAQWIISDNGVPVDKLDVKGLDVKRSSFPKAFQKVMGDVLIDILRGKTEEEITDYIVSFKKDMVNRNPVDLAKNSSVKNLSKFKVKGTKNLFQVAKGTPAHVKAAMMYNDCLKHFNAPFKYEPMKDGDKIKWIYLKNNPLGLDGLAFWGHSDPPEVEKFIKTYLDHNKVFERELQGKLQDFYDALGWGDIISEQKTAEKFFSF